jgi:ribosome biogenesis GTPase
MTADAGAAPFDEIAQLGRKCRFDNCQHDREPGCAVQAAIADGRLDPARLEAARHLDREAAWAQARSDPAMQREREREWRRRIRIENQEKDTW